VTVAIFISIALGLSFFLGLIFGAIAHAGGAASEPPRKSVIPVTVVVVPVRGGLLDRRV
jgi:hypothetical protein